MSADAKLTTRDTAKKEGLDIWAHGVVDGKDPEVDLVLVQGLNATPYRTWVGKRRNLEDAKNVSVRSKFKDLKLWSDKSKEPSINMDTTAGCFWPGELLPHHFTNARIATYSYASNWCSRSAATSLYECGEQLLGHLGQFRREETSRTRPIVFIGHSLGGLVVQQALVIADHGPEFRAIRKSMAGAIFLGTPHQGSTVADIGDWFQRAAHNDQPLLRTLRDGSEELHRLTRNFWDGYGTRLPVFCFFEQERSRYGGVVDVKTVTQQSSTMVGKRRMYLNTDHSGLNKFWGEKDENFRIVLSEMKEIMSFAAHRRHEKPAISPENVHWTITQSTNTLFTGRKDILGGLQKTIEIHLDNKNKHKQGRVVITGLGGQGKSEICLQLANRMRQRFWAVFWVDVSDLVVATSGFLSVAKRLQKSAETLQEALSALASIEQTWLLILDNADDHHFDYQGYFPPCCHGTVIMTSRISECKIYSTLRHEALEGLDPVSARDLLLKAGQFPPDRQDDCIEDARAVAAMLASHPLALIQAGSYVARGNCTLREYPEVYQHQRQRLIKFRPIQAKSRYGDVYATFEASAQILESSEGEAARDALGVLSVFSMLAPNMLPLELFELAWVGSEDFLETSHEDNDAGHLSRWHVQQLIPAFDPIAKDWDQFRLVEAFRLLQSLSLVTRDDTDGPKSFSMHPLAHAWARDRQDPGGGIQSWLATASMIALSSRYLFWDSYRRQLQPHLHALIKKRPAGAFAAAPELMIVRTLLSCGSLLHRAEDDLLLESLIKDLMIHLNIDFEDVNHKWLPLYTLAAHNLYRVGRYHLSLQVFQQIVHIRKHTRPVEHPDLLASQLELAISYQNYALFDEAISLLQHVIKIEKRTLKEEHPDLLASQGVLAIVYGDTGQFKKAIPLLQHVIKVGKRKLKEGHPDLLAWQHRLAIVYSNAGQPESAIPLLRHVIKVEKRTPVEEHPSQLDSQHTLASILFLEGQLEEAVDLMGYVVGISRKIFVPGHGLRMKRELDLAWMQDHLPSESTKNSLSEFWENFFGEV